MALRLLLFALLMTITAYADRPYVLLLSIDGFRADYAQRYQALNLIELGKRGVTARALLPCYPSSTFPNHYSIVTGLYPAHHGIVENHFYDREHDAEFHFNQEGSKNHPFFWNATPLWNYAEQQGIRTASYFWPGSDVAIQGRSPSLFETWDSNIHAPAQVDKVLTWLALPEKDRPHFLAVYFSEVDKASHANGPESSATAAAVALVDEALGKLMRGIERSGLPVNLVVVSDHGMAAVKGTIPASSLGLDLSGVRVSGASTSTRFYSDDPKKLDAIYQKLQGHEPLFSVYRKNEAPPLLHYSGSDRTGDLLLVMRQPYLVYSTPEPPAMKGAHGYPVESVPEMRGIFYAAGPAFRSGMIVDEFDNVHIFPLLAKILGLRVPAVDGNVSVLEPTLRK